MDNEYEKSFEYLARQRNREDFQAGFFSEEIFLHREELINQLTKNGSCEGSHMTNKEL